MGPTPRRGQTVASGVSLAMLVPIPEPCLENSASKNRVTIHKKDPPTALHALLEGPAHKQSILSYVLQDFIAMRE